MTQDQSIARGEVCVGAVVNNGHATFSVIAIHDGWAWVTRLDRRGDGPLTFPVSALRTATLTRGSENDQ